MRFALFLCLCLALMPTEAQAEEAGWIDLFNGRDLQGWTRRGGEAEYRVEKGAIVGSTVLDTSNTFLCTDRDYGDFTLELEFKVDPDLNSGVQIRSHVYDREKTAMIGGKTRVKPAGTVYGYQVEIDPSDRAWTGGIYDESRRGWLVDLSRDEAARKAFKAGAWNHFRIEARGSSIKTWVNGVLAADLYDGMTASGFIGLQVHSVGTDEERKGIETRWRNIRIKPYE